SSCTTGTGWVSAVRSERGCTRTSLGFTRSPHRTGRVGSWSGSGTDEAADSSGCSDCTATGSAAGSSTPGSGDEDRATGTVAGSASGSGEGVGSATGGVESATGSAVEAPGFEDGSAAACAVPDSAKD